jgi:hypothetical protein
VPISSPNHQSDIYPPLDRVWFPGAYKDDVMLNQVDLAIQRTTDVSNKVFDVGFMLEAFYGRDAAYTHSNGILDNRTKHGDTGPDDQLDLEQAYVTFEAAIGSGITVTAGKFVTPFGAETINPTNNLLYTHSYLFSYALPSTQTGVTVAYTFPLNITLTAGITRGWNQSTSDNNGAIDFLGELAWKSDDNKLSATLNFSEGPESTGDNHDYWTVIEPVVSWKIADQLTATGDLVYADANAIAQWYGVAGYLSYKTCDYASVNLRAEYFHDGRDFTVGVNLPYGTDVNYFEATLGLAINPLANIKLVDSWTIRPEFRVDVANHQAFDNAHYSQVTFAVDTYWKF